MCSENYIWMKQNKAKRFFSKIKLQKNKNELHFQSIDKMSKNKKKAKEK